MKGNVVWYGLETFHLEYGFLDEKYWNLEMYGQGTTQKSGRCLFWLYLIKEGIVRKNTNFNLADITQDERLLALLLPKNNDFYPISNFYNLLILNQQGKVLKNCTDLKVKIINTVI